jgi:phage gp29-like protein
MHDFDSAKRGASLPEAQLMISLYNTKDHRWRDAYNPLRGLSIQKLVSLLEAGERGQYADLQWFYHYMERSDAMVYSVVQRRRAALLELDWDIRVVSEAGSGTLAGRKRGISLAPASA